MVISKWKFQTLVEFSGRTQLHVTRPLESKLKIAPFTINIII